MHAIQRLVVWTIVVGAGCASNADGLAGDQGAPPTGCRASSECPAGTICNEFNVCVAPPQGSDAGVPAETELALGTPTSSDRYVYVAMTAQNALARIDGATLAVTSMAVGAAP